jgi:multidrug resistance protein, MATE family
LKKQILKLAIPNVVSNITIPIVSLVDIALVGSLGASHIGGVGFGTMVFTLVYTGLAFLRMGTNGLTAQAYGASDFKETAAVLVRALCLAVFAGVLLISLQVPIERLLISSLDGSPQALDFASEYFYTRIYAAPAALSVFVFMGWFVGMQNTRIPMWVTIIISVTNAAFSTYFVLYEGMGVKGVALGTVISQYVGLIASILFFLSRYKRSILLISRKAVLKINEIKRFFNVSRDIFVRSVLLTGSFFLFNAVSAQLGDDTLALNSVMLQFLWFFAHFADGFAYAGGTLAGRYKGERKPALLNKVVSDSVKLGFIMALIFSIIYFICATPAFKLLTDDANVLQLASDFRYWVWIMPLASFAAFIYDGIYIGITATAIQRNVMIVTILVVFVPFLFLLKHYAGNQGMWAAIIAMLILRGIGLRMFIRKAIGEVRNVY